MDADSSLNHVFFPDSGVVSVVAVYADGSLRYAHVRQVAQSATCNQFHSIPQRCCRWLLEVRRNDGET